MLLVLLFSLGFTLPTDPDEGLVAYFNFDECDGRGAGGVAELFGSVECRCGVVGQALFFDGDDYLTFDGAINDYFTTSDFTLSFYLKPAGHQALPQALFTKDADCALDHMLALQYVSNGNELRTLLHESANKAYRRLEFPLPTAGWLHYTLVREGGEARTYLNGQLQRQTRRCSGVDLSNAVPLRFGQSRCRTAPFKGRLDELRLYDRALNDSAVKALYQRAPIENAEVDCMT